MCHQTEDEQQEKLLRAQVASGLSQLPGPKNEYQIQVPEVGPDAESTEPVLEEDAADRKTRLAAEKVTPPLPPPSLKTRLRAIKLSSPTKILKVGFVCVLCRRRQRRRG